MQEPRRQEILESPSNDVLERPSPLGAALTKVLADAGAVTVFENYPPSPAVPVTADHAASRIQSCFVCRAPAPQEVVDYCRRNRPRFGSRIYCKTCQKRIPPV